MLSQPPSMAILLSLLLVGGLGYVINSVGTYYLVDTGRVNLDGTNSVIYNYSITFNHAFDNEPQILFGVARLQLCPSSSSELFSLAISKQAGKVQTYILLQFQAFANLNVGHLEVNYFAYDASYVQYIHYYEMPVLMYSGDDDATSSVAADGYNASSAKTHIACFIHSLGGYTVSSLPYTITAQCSAASDDSIQVKAYNNNDLSYALSYPDPVFHIFPIYYKQVTVNVFVVIQDDSMQVNFNSMTASSNAASAPVAFLGNSEETYIFVGLTSFQQPLRCFGFSLSSDNRQILAGSFNEIVFEYVIIAKSESGLTSSTLSNIQTYSFSLKVQFKYLSIVNLTELKLNQFWLNTSALSIQKIRSVGPDQLILITNLTAEISQDFVMIVFNYSLAARMYNKTAVLKIVAIKEISIDPTENSINIKVLNTRDADRTKFSYNSLMFTLKEVIQQADYSMVESDYDLGVFGNQYALEYQDNTFGDYCSMYFLLPKLTKIKTSILNRTIILVIQDIPSQAPATTSEFSQSSSCVQNVQAASGIGTQIMIDYIKEAGAADCDFALKYIWSPVSNFEIDWKLKLMTLLSVKSINDSSTFELTFINLKNPSSVSPSQFAITQPGVGIQSVSSTDSQVVLTIQCDQTVNGALYEIQFVPENTSYSVLIQDVMTFNQYKQISSERYMNNLDIFLKNVDNSTPSTLPNVSFSIPYIRLQKIQLTADNLIKISTTYNHTIDHQQLEIYYTLEAASVFYNIISFPLSYEFPLTYCVGQLEFLSNMYTTFATTLQYAYLAFFWYAFVCSSKLLAVQTIFLAQFAFCSMIPIGLNCPYVGLNSLRHVNGINPFFKGLKQASIPFSYQDLGFQSNFISNVNLMIILLVLCPFLYLILTYYGNRSDCYKKKPRLLRWGKSFICQVPLAMLLFNSFNIYSSLAIEIQFLGAADPISLVVALIISLLLPLYAIGFVKFHSYFSEFRQEFETTQRVGSFSREASTRIRLVYPLVLVFQSIAVPLFLAAQSLHYESLYVAIAISFAVLAYVLVATPYTHKFDNIRLITHRVLALGICGVQIAFEMIADDTTSGNTFVFWIPLVLLSLVALGLLLNGVQIIRSSVEWFKRRGIIDLGLKIKKEGPRTRPTQVSQTPEDIDDDTRWYPKLQYGKDKKKQVFWVVRKLQHQQQLQAYQENLLKAAQFI